MNEAPKPQRTDRAATRAGGWARHAPFLIGLAVFVYVFVQNAWVAEDAYITFRSVEQLFAGNGLRWNSTPP